MNMNVEMTVDAEEVKNFITSENFTQFLLNNTTDFAVAGYILTVLMNDLEQHGVSFDSE